MWGEHPSGIHSLGSFNPSTGLPGVPCTQKELVAETRIFSSAVLLETLTPRFFSSQRAKAFFLHRQSPVNAGGDWVRNKRNFVPIISCQEQDSPQSRKAKFEIRFVNKYAEAALIESNCANAKQGGETKEKHRIQRIGQLTRTRSDYANDRTGLFGTPVHVIWAQMFLVMRWCYTSVSIWENACG